MFKNTWPNSQCYQTSEAFGSGLDASAATAADTSVQM